MEQLRHGTVVKAHTAVDASPDPDTRELDLAAKPPPWEKIRVVVKYSGVPLPVAGGNMDLSTFGTSE